MSPTNEIFLIIAGAAMLFLVFYDIHATVLRATKQPGPFSTVLNRGSWWLATRLTRRLERRRRHRALSKIGPLLMPSIIIVFISVLVTGFALIYLPRLETDFKIDEASQTGRIFQAFYISGVTFLTIGYGDFVPISTLTRSLAVVEAATGLAIISLSVTYLLSVYGALERKRAVALKFYHQARQGADIAGFVASHFARGRFHGLTEALRESTRDLQEQLESHMEHPVLHYFHPPEIYKSFPRALFVVLETVAILDAHLDEKEYIEAGDHPDVLVAGDNACYVLAELIAALSLQTGATESFESEAETVRRRRKSFDRAMKILQKAQIKTRADDERAFLEYSEDRARWEPQLFRFAEFLGYDWDEITGDRDLEDATDDEVTERHEPARADAEAIETSV